MIRVLVVDDQDLVRSGICRLLADAEQVAVVGEAASGEEAIQKSRDLEPDVVLMDINMPGIGGLEATQKILQRQPEIQIIALTVYDGDPYTSRLLKMGASGYLTKGAHFDEMLRAIIKVNSGQKYISPDIAQKMALRPFQEDSASPFDDLSERELQISIMVAKGQPVKTISEALFLSPKTVNSYRYRIFEKLGIDKNDVQLTHLALRHGLINSNEVN
ncbi:MAG: UvrY/SirA/GacA family response regulator transcription factor [Thalassolituus sp.]